MPLAVKIKLIDPRWGRQWPLPSQHSSGAAAYDLRLALEHELNLAPGACELVATGIAIHIATPGYFALLAPRSGWGHRGLVLGNGVGVIDSDYQGEIKLSLYNRNSNKSLLLQPGERVAQMLFLPCAAADFIPVEEFSASARGTSGFGSTGTD